MKKRKLTATDVCEVTGYNRDQLKGLLKKLPQFAKSEISLGVVREFTPQEMVVLRIIFILENRIGINRTNTASIAGHLSMALSGPKELDKNAHLFISFDPVSVQYGTKGLPKNDGVVLSLGSVFERVDRYLIPDVSFRQTGLSLGPVLVTNKSTKSAA